MNSNCPHGRSIESVENRKIWRENHRDQLCANKKTYRENNKDKIKADKKIYRESNKDNIHAYNKNNKDSRQAYDCEYHKKNIDKINLRKKVRYVCECGNELSCGYKSEHNKTAFHIDFIFKQKNLSLEYLDDINLSKIIDDDKQ